MTCTWTGSYTYQPDTPETEKCYNDRICDAVMEYVKERGNEHNMSIVTTVDNNSWWLHGKPVEITCYHLKSGDEVIPIEEVAAKILAYYECYLEDEASNFGEDGYFYSTPYEADDLTVFTREMMVEWWS